MERGVAARALVRRSDPHLPLPSVHVDLDAPATLVAALDGVERLLLLTPHGPNQGRQEAAAVENALAAGVRRIVKISGSAASLGPNGPAPTAVAHWLSEQRIERTGLEFTFLRPAFYMENLLDTFARAVAAIGVLASPFGSTPIAMIDGRDVAACAVAALLDRDHVSQAWQLTGPRTVTIEGIAKHLGARHLKLPLGITSRVMRRRGLTPFEVEHAIRMAAYFAAGSDGVVTDHVVRLSGRPPRKVEAFLNEHRDAFAPATKLAQILCHPTIEEPT